MNPPHEPQHSFLGIGNAFRMLLPKGLTPSSWILSLLETFEMNLAVRLRKLIPKDRNEIMSMSWMKLAMQLLCETHSDVNALITGLQLPVSDWEDKWIDVYLDISVKLLDLCIVFSSELTRLNQSRLLLQCFLHNLESNNPDKYMRARSSLDIWRRHICSKSFRSDNCHSILVAIVDSLSLPKAKNSTKAKVLMQALYGVKFATVYICGIFGAALSGSGKHLLDLSPCDKLLWAEAFSDMQTAINVKIKDAFLNGQAAAFNEHVAVDATVRTLYPMIQDGVDFAGAELFKNSVSGLKTEVEKLSRGLDFLSEEMDRFFEIVLAGRDALLCNFRSPTTITRPALTRLEQQVVR